MRELAIRGIDGPTLHVLDVVPDAYAHVPGIEGVLAARQAQLEVMMSQPPPMFRSRVAKQAQQATFVETVEQVRHECGRFCFLVEYHFFWQVFCCCVCLLGGWVEGTF